MERADDAPTIGHRLARIGQIPISWDPDEERRSSGPTTSSAGSRGGWQVNADLPTTAGFAGASQFVQARGCRGRDPVRARPRRDRGGSPADFWEAGFTDIALVQVGDEAQERFLDEAAHRCSRSCETQRPHENSGS